MADKQLMGKQPKRDSAITDADMDALYRHPASLSDWLPWVDYDESSETFTLEDGFSAAAMFEITGVSTEARSSKFLQEVQANIQTCINHTIPAHDNPFVLQCFVSDEDSLAALSQSLNTYTESHCRETPEHRLLAINFVARMQRHFKRMTQSAGLFEDNTVTGGSWRGKVRRVRVFLYRRRELNDNEHIDPVTEINQVAERFVTQMAATGIGIRRCDDHDLYAWLLRWFNPRAEVTEGDLDKLSELMELPEKKERAFSHDLSDLLFLSQPSSDGGHGVWYFDDLPHRAITVDALRRKPLPGHFTGERQVGDNLYALFDKLPEGSILSLCLTLQPQDLVENHVVQVLNSAKGETAEAMAAEQDAKEALKWMSHGDYLLPTVITLFTRGDSLADLQKKTNEVNALLLANGLHPIREKDELLPLDTYIRQLPMNYEPKREKVNKKSRLVFSSDLARLLPFYGRSRGTGHPGLVFFNRGGEPLTFDPLNKLDRAKNAFGLVLGPPGSGKSALMVYILLQVAATYGARIYIIEKGGSFKLLGDYCRYFGLSVNQVTLHPKEDVSLPPFADAYEMLKRERAQQASFDEEPSAYEDASLDASDNSDDDEERDLLGEMELKARIMITGGDSKEEAVMTRADRLTIRRAIILAAEEKQAAGSREIVLTEDVVNALNKLAADESSTPKRQERARDMADAMALYCSGTAGHFFNRVGKAWPEADVTIMEMGLLANEGYEDQLALGFMGLMNQINGVVEREQYDHRPTFVLGDEAHLITTNPLLAIFLVKIVKMWRKLGAWLWLATQNLEDFPDAAKKLLSMFEWWIAMVCPKEEIEQISRFKDLTEEQKGMLRAARKEPGNYTEGVVLSDNLQCLFRNVPPPLALALAMTEKHEKQQRAEIMKSRHCSELEAVFAVADGMGSTEQG
ncbi:MAG: conjugative transfer ATPase [Cellvibrionaceae bacterium]|nr:conjugative transfer ATPase [Cellvibrionaceae bacterium]MBN57969.1 conjugative transfer ATPase [Oceanospirillaceae bacterium]|tara:strand:+ start:3728 stop:6472 length:2745 start_codon:yes stop_codon:yes gene_type:complete